MFLASPPSLGPRGLPGQEGLGCSASLRLSGRLHRGTFMRTKAQDAALAAPSGVNSFFSLSLQMLINKTGFDAYLPKGWWGQTAHSSSTLAPFPSLPGAPCLLPLLLPGL